MGSRVLRAVPLVERNVARLGGAGAVEGWAEEEAAGSLRQEAEGVSDSDSDSDGNSQPGMITDDSEWEEDEEDEELEQEEMGTLTCRSRRGWSAFKTSGAGGSGASCGAAGGVNGDRARCRVADVGAEEAQQGERIVESLAKVRRMVSPAVARARAQRQGDSPWKAAHRAKVGEGPAAKAQRTAPPVTLLTHTPARRTRPPHCVDPQSETSIFKPQLRANGLAKLQFEGTTRQLFASSI